MGSPLPYQLLLGLFPSQKQVQLRAVLQPRVQSPPGACLAVSCISLTSLVSGFFWATLKRQLQPESYSKAPDRDSSCLPSSWAPAAAGGPSSLTQCLHADRPLPPPLSVPLSSVQRSSSTAESWPEGASACPWQEQRAGLHRCVDGTVLLYRC